MLSQGFGCNIRNYGRSKRVTKNEKGHFEMAFFGIEKERTVQ